MHQIRYSIDSLGCTGVLKYRFLWAGLLAVDALFCVVCLSSLAFLANRPDIPPGRFDMIVAAEYAYAGSAFPIGYPSRSNSLVC